MEKCLALFQLDYNTVEINNRAGELSSHYPSLIVIPENEKPQKPNGLTSTIQATSTSNGSLTPPTASATATLGLPNVSVSSTNSTAQRTQQQTIYENAYDPAKLRELMNKARFARSRTRFPVPVILYKGKFVCRSSTLSCGPELYARHCSFNYFFNAGTGAARQSGSDDVDLCGEGNDSNI